MVCISRIYVGVGVGVGVALRCRRRGPAGNVNVKDVKVVVTGRGSGSRERKAAAQSRLWSTVDFWWFTVLAGRPGTSRCHAVKEAWGEGRGEIRERERSREEKEMRYDTMRMQCDVEREGVCAVRWW
jgi:hypothetical protein